MFQVQIGRHAPTPLCGQTDGQAIPNTGARKGEKATAERLQSDNVEQRENRRGPSHLTCQTAWDDSKDGSVREARLRRTVTAVGDGACGKTSLLLRMSQDVFVEQVYEPTTFESDVVEVFRGTRKMQLTLQDCAGQETYDRMRPVAYADVHVILLCFSLDNPDSLVNAETTWFQEVTYYCPAVPLILVGNKKDLRDAWETTETKDRPNGATFVTCQQGQDAARRLKAKDYIECSAKTSEGVKRVLGTSVRYSTLQKA